MWFTWSFRRELLISREIVLQVGQLYHCFVACGSRFRSTPANLFGSGHESNACPHPRTTETKQCYHCQGLGHVQADCPTLRLSGGSTGGRCYSCGQPGHLARNCPSAGGHSVPMGRGGYMPRGGGSGFAMRGGYGGGPRPATCHKCGGPNHYARDCQAQAMKCYACGKLGHISRDCTAPNGGPLNTAGKTCYRCGETGHISRDCPQNVDKTNQITRTTNITTPAATSNTNSSPDSLGTESDASVSTSNDTSNSAAVVT